MLVTLSILVSLPYGNEMLKQWFPTGVLRANAFFNISFKILFPNVIKAQSKLEWIRHWIPQILFLCYRMVQAQKVGKHSVKTCHQHQNLVSMFCFHSMIFVSNFLSSLYVSFQPSRWKGWKTHNDLCDVLTAMDSHSVINFFVIITLQRIPRRK